MTQAEFNAAINKWLTDNGGTYNSAFTGAEIDEAIGKIRSLGGPYLSLSGGTMTGALTLVDSPAEDLHATPKKYVDDSISSAIGLVLEGSY